MCFNCNKSDKKIISCTEKLHFENSIAWCLINIVQNVYAGLFVGSWTSNYLFDAPNSVKLENIWGGMVYMGKTHLDKYRIDGDYLCKNGLLENVCFNREIIWERNKLLTWIHILAGIAPCEIIGTNEEICGWHLPLN